MRERERNEAYADVAPKQVIRFQQQVAERQNKNIEEKITQIPKPKVSAFGFGGFQKPWNSTLSDSSVSLP